MYVLERCFVVVSPSAWSVLVHFVGPALVYVDYEDDVVTEAGQTMPFLTNILQHANTGREKQCGWTEMKIGMGEGDSADKKPKGRFSFVLFG